MKVTIAIENAKMELRECVYNARKKYGLPASIMKGIVSSIMNEIMEDAKEELARDYRQEICELAAELEKAKAAAKKVLKAEPEQVSESDTGQQGGNPEEVKRNGSTGKADDTNQH